MNILSVLACITSPPVLYVVSLCLCALLFGTKYVIFLVSHLIYIQMRVDFARILLR